MDKDKRKRLEAAGWTVEDSPQDLLGLSDQEMAAVDERVRRAESQPTVVDIRERWKEDADNMWWQNQLPQTVRDVRALLRHLNAATKRAKEAERELPIATLQLVDAVNNLLDEIATGDDRVYGFDPIVQVVHDCMKPFNLTTHKPTQPEEPHWAKMREWGFEQGPSEGMWAIRSGRVYREILADDDAKRLVAARWVWNGEGWTGPRGIVGEHTAAEALADLEGSDANRKG